MRQQREPENEGYASALPRPLWTPEEDECRCGGADDRKSQRMRDRAMSNGPFEKIDVWKGGEGGRDEAHAARRRPLLRPGGDRESHCGMRDGCGHLANLRLVQREPQIEDVRVEAGVL